MRVALLADDRPGSGLGHVMRCEALGQALRDRGHRITFAGHDAPLPDGPDVIVVDSYAAGDEELHALAQRAPLCVIDDLADRDLRAARMVVNQNFGAERLPYNAGDAEMLLGPSFAMLRAQFREARETQRTHRSGRHVLLTLGGADVGAMLRAAIGSLEAVREPLRITILAREPAWNAPSHHAIAISSEDEPVAGLMASVCLAVTGAGVTSIELACTGTPSIVITLAPNQQPGAAALQACGAAIDAGPFDIALKRLANDVESLLADEPRRAGLAAAGMSAVDGRGAARVATRLESILRP